MPMLSPKRIKEIIDAMNAAKAHGGAIGGAGGVSWDDQTASGGGGGAAGGDGWTRSSGVPDWWMDHEVIKDGSLPVVKTRPDARDILIAALIKAGNKLNPNFSPGAHQEKLIWIEWQQAVKAAAEALFDGIVPIDEPEGGG